MTRPLTRHARPARALVTALLAAASSAVAVVSANAAQAAGNGLSGEDPVSGYSQQQCDQAGAVIAQQRQNQGYTTTFVGCSYDGFASPSYQGSVLWADRGAGTGGQDPVSGYSQQQCDEAGTAQAQVRQGQGYTTTFVGCSYDGFAFPSYRGTVLYHEGSYA